MERSAQTELIPCPLCQSRSSRKYLIKFGLSIVRCQACGLIHTNPRLSESEVNLRYGASYFFNEYLPIFQAGPDSFSIETAENHYRLYLDVLAALLSPGKRLLDIGCGAGFFVKAAANSGWKAGGSEISEVAAEYARTVTRVPVVIGQLEDLNMPARAYDVITMLDLLEHLFEPLSTLREARRIMKDGAVLIISTPDVESLSRRFLGPAWAVLSPAEHQCYFAAKTLGRALRQTGFRVVAIKNLLNFNPDYTHRPGALRHRLWKACSRGLERTAMMRKIHRHEYLDLGHSVREPDSAPLSTGTLAVKRRIYSAAKAWLRGDILVALARKV